MPYLVDTKGWFGFLEGNRKFGPEAKFWMIESSSECFISIASIWEAAIKVGMGKLALPYDLRDDLPGTLDENSFQLLAVEYADAVAVGDLPRLHGDSFDRIMAVQARLRGWSVISSDPTFEQYGLRRIW